MLHDDYLCLVESGKQQIKEVRRKFNRKTWKQGQLLSESGFILRIAPPPLSRDRRIKMKKSIKSMTLMRICPNEKFIEIFGQRFHDFEDSFYKFFALNLLYQDTSYSFALKYSHVLFEFFNFAFYSINFWFKISKICPKI